MSTRARVFTPSMTLVRSVTVVTICRVAGPPPPGLALPSRTNWVPGTNGRNLLSIFVGLVKSRLSNGTIDSQAGPLLLFRATAAVAAPDGLAPAGAATATTPKVIAAATAHRNA